MIVLKIIGIVLLAVILLLFIIALLPVKVVVELQGVEEVGVYFKFLFLTFGKKKNKKSKVADTLSGATGVNKKEKKVKDKKDIGKIVSLVIDIIKQVTSLVKHCKLQKLHVFYVSAGDDPGEVAINYGIACSAIYPITGILFSAVNVKDRGVDVDVRCDFNSNESIFEFQGEISVKIYYLLIAVVKFLKEQVKK